jgi:hypothetical protein
VPTCELSAFWGPEILALRLLRPCCMGRWCLNLISVAPVTQDPVRPGILNWDVTPREKAQSPQNGLTRLEQNKALMIPRMRIAFQKFGCLNLFGPFLTRTFVTTSFKMLFNPSLTVVTLLSFFNFCIATYDAAARSNLAMYWVCLPQNNSRSVTHESRRAKGQASSVFFISANNLQSTSFQLDSLMFSQLREMGIPVQTLETNAGVGPTSTKGPATTPPKISFNHLVLKSWQIFQYARILMGRRLFFLWEARRIHINSPGQRTGQPLQISYGELLGLRHRHG